MKVTILINGKKYLHLVANFSKVQGLLLNYRFADQQIRVLFSEEEGDFTPAELDTFSNNISSHYYFPKKFTEVLLPLHDMAAAMLFHYSLFHLKQHHYVALVKNNLCWTLLTHEPQYDDAGVDYVAGYFAVFYLAMTSQKTGINEPF